MKRLILFAAAALAAAGCHSSNPVPDPSPRVQGEVVVYPTSAGEIDSLSVAPAEAGSPAVARTTGRLSWDEDHTARVFSPVTGRVARLVASPEQRVAAGATLALLDSPDFGQAQADANRAATDLANSERTLARTRALFEHGAAARKEVEAAEADAARARVESERARRRLALYGGSLGAVDQRFALRSPLGGVVVERTLNPGQEVRSDATAPFFTVSDPSRLWVLLDITERDVSLVRPGMALSLRTAAWPDRTFSGRIEVVGSSLDPATRTVKARGSVPNPGGLLKAEMYVDVEISAPESRPEIQVPSAAVVADGRKHYVFVEEAKGRYHRQPVEPGPERSGQTQILAGLATGDRVVVDGSLLLQSLFTDKT